MAVTLYPMTKAQLKETERRLVKKVREYILSYHKYITENYFPDFGKRGR